MSARHGWLRQGRGAGYLAALEGGEAVIAELYDCVLNDPRWDRQVEEREGYYAELLIATGADLGPLRVRLLEEGRASAGCAPPLVFDVVAEMCRRGHAVACEVLASVGDGESQPDECTSNLADEDESSEKRTRATRSMPEHGRVELLPAAIEFLTAEANRGRSSTGNTLDRGAWLSYLAGLPASQSRPLAYGWAKSAWPLSLTADEILVRHATPEDRALIEEIGFASLAASDMYRVCSMVEAADKVGPAESLAFLTTVYEQSPYSYARRLVVKALTGCAGMAAADRILHESLWDSESDVRASACSAIVEPTTEVLA